MSRIIVTPEQLNELSRQMTQSANQLCDMEGQLGRALNGMDWNVRQQVNIDGQVNAARSQVSQLADQANSLASFLTDRAAAFLKADQEGAQAIDSTFQPYYSPNLPSLESIFDVFKASLSTILIFVESAGLAALGVVAGAVDFFLLKMPKAEEAFTRWEDYNNQSDLSKWDRATADKYQEDARKALDDLGLSTLKDSLDLVVDKIPKGSVVDEALKKIYDAIGSLTDWAGAVGSTKP